MRYLRPESIEQALSLLGEGIPLGGGTTLTPARSAVEAVIDLSKLGLDGFTIKDGTASLGATLTLQTILEHSDRLPAALIDGIRHESGLNLRNAATLAGMLVAADGRSPALTVLTALGGIVKLEPGTRQVELNEFFSLRTEQAPQFLITGLEFRLPKRLAYAQVARTPMDKPIVCASAGLSPDGDLTLALGGYGPHPIRFYQAGTGLKESQGLNEAKDAAEAAFSRSEDAFASAAYRSHIAGVLIERVVKEVRG